VDHAQHLLVNVRRGPGRFLFALPEDPQLPLERRRPDVSLASRAWQSVNDSPELLIGNPNTADW